MLKPGRVELLIAFFPWIAFGLLSHSHPQVALLVALGASALQVVAHFRRPKVLEWVSLVFFSVAFLALFVFHWQAFAHHMGLIVHVLLASVAWGSLLGGVPFTIQYARESVPEKYWHEPHFIRTNQWITAVWGVDFVLQAMVLEWQATYGGGIPSLVSSLITAATLGFTLWFPAHRRKTGTAISPET